MTEDKPMLMQSLNQADGVLYMDLSKPPTDEIEDDRPVSIRDAALVVLEYAAAFMLHDAPGGWSATWTFIV